MELFFFLKDRDLIKMFYLSLLILKDLEDLNGYGEEPNKRQKMEEDRHRDCVSLVRFESLETKISDIEKNFADFSQKIDDILQIQTFILNSFP